MAYLHYVLTDLTKYGCMRLLSIYIEVLIDNVCSNYINMCVGVTFSKFYSLVLQTVIRKHNIRTYATYNTFYNEYLYMNDHL